MSVIEIISVDDFRYDGKINYLPGLTTKSLAFHQIIKEPSYKAVLGFSDLDINLINEFRNLRNEIHFPHDAIETPVRASYPVPIFEFLVSFINEWIVHRVNSIGGKRELCGMQLPLLN